MNLNIVNLGLIPYSDALEIQYKLFEKRLSGEIEDTLILLEHPPVLTLGTRGEYKNIYLNNEELKRQGIETFEVSRGGDVTYHGPGQIVGYLIFDLRLIDKDIRLFIDKIQQSIIDLLFLEFNISAYSEKDKYTGVWVDDKKMAAIGISIKKWISMHGFAFNVNTNLDHFKWINPCGLSKGVTSVEEVLGKTQDMKAVFEMVIKHFSKEFGLSAVNKNFNDLI